MSNLSLIPVTSKNRRAIEKLKVFPHQTGFIESVADCMKEADQLAAWHPMCIYDNDTLIGFTMYGMIQEPAYTRLWFDRLLIDKAFQGRGYAKAAIAALLERLRQEYPCRRVYLSVYGDNAAAIHLYQQAGFSFRSEERRVGKECRL